MGQSFFKTWQTNSDDIDFETGETFIPFMVMFLQNNTNRMMSGTLILDSVSALVRFYGFAHFDRG